MTDTVTAPPWIAELPTDARGFHTPAEAGWLDGKPLFSKFHVDRTVALALLRGCAVCGYTMPKGTLVYRGFALGDALHIREFERDQSHDDAGPLHYSCMLYSAIVCPYLRSNGRLAKDSLVNPGAQRGRRAAVMGFKDMGLLVPVDSQRHNLPYRRPMVAYHELTHDISYREGGELLDRFTAAVEADTQIIDMSESRLFWTDAQDDLNALEKLRAEEYRKLTSGEPAYEMVIQQNPSPPYASNVGPYLVFNL